MILKMNKLRCCILLILNIQLVMMKEKPDCNKKANSLYDKLKNSVPEVKVVRRNTIKISWKYLIDDITLSCFNQIVLKGGDVDIIASKDDMDKIGEHKSFKYDMNICQERQYRQSQ